VRRLLLVLACLALTALGVVAWVGSTLSAPRRAVIGASAADWPATSIQIPYPGGQLAGWMRPGLPGHGVVLLLHGVRADRRQMRERARFLAQDGFGVLLVDLPGHGESQGEQITFGAREAAGVQAALDFLRKAQPGERIGVIGASLGAAALVLARPAGIDAAVLEAMYPTIEEAVENRLRIVLGQPGALLAPLLLQQLPLRLDVTAAQLRPIDAVAALPCPVLVAAGARDLHTTAAETRRIFDAAAEPKQLWLVENAAHVDLHAFAGQAYQERVGAFLRQHLRR
jgi:fermentation-respiration switch protein FrsA (DUF1100 family)